MLWNNGAAVVKTPRGGYDGKGVRVVREATAADDWFSALAEDGNGGSLLAEELVDFRRELAQSVARRPSGQIAAWTVVESIQRDGVCAATLSDYQIGEGEILQCSVRGGSFRFAPWAE